MLVFKSILDSDYRCQNWTTPHLGAEPRDELREAAVAVQETPELVELEVWLEGDVEAGRAEAAAPALPLLCHRAALR